HDGKLRILSGLAVWGREQHEVGGAPSGNFLNVVVTCQNPMRREALPASFRSVGMDISDASIVVSTSPVISMLRMRLDWFSIARSNTFLARRALPNIPLRISYAEWEHNPQIRVRAKLTLL